MWPVTGWQRACAKGGGYLAALALAPRGPRLQSSANNYSKSAFDRLPAIGAVRLEPIIDRKLRRPYSGSQAVTDEFNEVMRLAFGLITCLAWLVLSPFPSASGANVLSHEWSGTLHGGSDSRSEEP